MRFINMFASGHTENALVKLKILKDEEARAVFIEV